MLLGFLPFLTYTVALSEPGSDLKRVHMGSYGRSWLPLRFSPLSSCGFLWVPVGPSGFLGSFGFLEAPMASHVFRWAQGGAQPLTEQDDAPRCLSLPWRGFGMDPHVLATPNVSALDIIHFA